MSTHFLHLAPNRNNRKYCEFEPVLGTWIHMCVRVCVRKVQKPKASVLNAAWVFSIRTLAECVSQKPDAAGRLPRTFRESCLLITAHAHTCPAPLEHCCLITHPEILTGSQQQTHSGGMLWANICNFPGTRYKIQSETHF